MSEKSLFEQLQQILLQEDRKRAQDFQENIGEIRVDLDDLKDEVSGIKDGFSDLKDNFDDPDKLGKKVDPLVEHKITQLKENFHEVFGYEVKRSIKLEIENSKDEFIEMLYPIIGQLVGRYVRYQFDEFLDNVSQKMENTFSLDWWGKRVKSVFTGVSHTEMMIKEAMYVKVEEVFVIHRNSGLLIGCYSAKDTTDVDMIAGMLTAIKQFVDDAFKTETGGGLDAIEYGNDKIIITNFHTYYIATVISGIVDANYKSRLNNHLMEFAGKHIPGSVEEIDDVLFDRVSEKLLSSVKEFESKR